MDHNTSQAKMDNVALWRRRLAEQAASGLTIRDWCRQAGYSDSLFHFWKTSLAKRDGTYAAPRRKAGAPKPAAAATPAFARVVVSAPASASAACVEIVLGGGRVVRVGAGFDEATLARVLAVLEGEPC